MPEPTAHPEPLPKCGTCQWWYEPAPDYMHQPAECMVDPPVVLLGVGTVLFVRPEVHAEDRCSRWEPAS